MRFHPDNASVLAFRLTLLAVGLLCGVAASSQQCSGTAARRTAARFDEIRRDPLVLRSFLYAFPKGADLHNHLAGAVYAESYIDWAADMQLCVDLSTHGFVEPAQDSPSNSRCEPGRQQPATAALGDPALYRQIVDALSMRNHRPTDGSARDHFFDAFGKLRAVARGGVQGSDRIAGQSLAEVARRAALQHVQHLEVIIPPDDSESRELAAGLPWRVPEDFAAFRDGLLKAGLRDALADRRRWIDSAEHVKRTRLGCDAGEDRPGCQLSMRYVAYVQRGMSPAQVFAQMLFAFELATADSRVVAVNPVQPEDEIVALRDYDLHMRMFAFMHRLYPNVGITLHAGELARGQVAPGEIGWHVRRAVETGAGRIGHGADVMYDPHADDLLRDMARRRIAVEINLTTNDYILGLRGPHHPLRHYLDAGVPVVISTDDEGVARTDLTHEYQRAVEEHHVTYAELKQISRNGIDYAFLPDGEKRALKDRLEQALMVFERSFEF